jgi:hypothetical protein
MDLSVITITWNSADKIGEQIASVFSGCSNTSCEQIIVDNASADETVQKIKENYPQIKLIENKKNKGFAVANNKAFKIAKGEFVLFLNPDMKLKEDSLDKLVEWMKNKKEVGIASIKLLDKNGKINVDAMPRRLPKVWEQVFLILKLHHLFPKVLNSYLMKDFDFEKEQEVDSVRGSFMLVRHDFLDKLGYAFDPRYFIWFEDVDLCHEAKKAGLKVVYTPIISCIDFFGQSFKKQESVWKQKQFTQSMLLYFQKWEPAYKWIWIWLARPVGIFMVWILNGKR